VRGVHHGGATASGVAKDSVQLRTCLAIEPGMRLVEEPQPGSSHDECGQRRSASLAGGQCTGARRSDARVDSQTVEGGLDIVRAGPHELCDEFHVLPRGEVGVQAVVMPEQSHHRSHDVALTRDVKPENVRASARQRCKSRTQTKKCRLPGAVGTTERNQFTATNDEIDTGKRRKSTERHDDTSEMNGWFGGK